MEAFAEKIRCFTDTFKNILRLLRAGLNNGQTGQLPRAPLIEGPRAFTNFSRY